MTFQAIWEYKKGQNIKNDEIDKALMQKNNCSKEVNDIFKNKEKRIQEILTSSTPWRSYQRAPRRPRLLEIFT